MSDIKLEKVPNTEPRKTAPAEVPPPKQELKAMPISVITAADSHAYRELRDEKYIQDGSIIDKTKQANKAAPLATPATIQALKSAAEEHMKTAFKLQHELNTKVSYTETQINEQSVLQTKLKNSDPKAEVISTRPGALPILAFKLPVNPNEAVYYMTPNDPREINEVKALQACMKLKDQFERNIGVFWNSAELPRAYDVHLKFESMDQIEGQKYKVPQASIILIPKPPMPQASQPPR